MQQTILSATKLFVACFDLLRSKTLSHFIIVPAGSVFLDLFNCNVPMAMSTEILSILGT